MATASLRWPPQGAPQLSSLTPIQKVGVGKEGAGLRLGLRRRSTPRAVPDLLAGRHPAEEVFDLVLAWDLLDLVDADVAAGLAREMRSRLRAGGMVWALFDTSLRTAPALPRRFRIVNEHSLEHQLLTGRVTARLIHQNRDILRMFDGFEVLSSTHLRVGLREMLFGRAAASAT